MSTSHSFPSTPLLSHTETLSIFVSCVPSFSCIPSWTVQYRALFSLTNWDGNSLLSSTLYSQRSMQSIEERMLHLASLFAGSLEKTPRLEIILRVSGRRRQKFKPWNPESAPNSCFGVKHGGGRQQDQANPAAWKLQEGIVDFQGDSGSFMSPGIIMFHLLYGDCWCRWIICFLKKNVSIIPIFCQDFFSYNNDQGLLKFTKKIKFSKNRKHFKICR